MPAIDYRETLDTMDAAVAVEAQAERTYRAAITAERNAGKYDEALFCARNDACRVLIEARYATIEARNAMLRARHTAKRSA